MPLSSLSAIGRVDLGAMSKRTESRGFFYQLVSIFCLLAIGIGIAGYLYYRNQREQIKKNAYHELHSIAGLKVSQISVWREERMADALTFTEDPASSLKLREWLRNQGDSRVRDEIFLWIRSLKEHSDYDNILLTDAQGIPRLTVTPGTQVDTQLQDQLEQAMTLKIPILSDLYRSEADGSVRLCLTAPIFDPQDEEAPVIGALLLEIDPYRLLYPLVQSWPALSRTSETLLIRREGDDVLFLNKLRHKEDAELSLRMPLSSRGLIAARALSGEDGEMQGMDYRNVRVLAYARAVPDSSWLLIAKTDFEEVYAPIRRLALLVAFVVGVMIAGAGVSLSLVWSKQQQEALRKVHEELERKIEERTAKLAKANEELGEKAALLELAHDAILVRDLEDKIVFWNEGAVETYGWTADEALGKIFCALLSTEFPRPPHELKEELFEKGRWEGELVHTTRAGKRIVVASRWALQMDSFAGPRGILEINRDITEQKTSEEELKEYTAKLERSNRDLADFAFIASHDLQEPLRKIQIFGKMLMEDNNGCLSGEKEDYIARMWNAANRMQILIDDLLKYSRVTVRFEPTVSVDLNILVKEVLGDLSCALQKTGGSIECSELPTIEADRTQMLQLLQNLISNALKFHGKEAPVVRIYCPGGNDNVCEISVEDNGIGFDERYLDRIFVPFQRLHGRGEYEGTGIGLAICRKIVERHGGTITARSTPGKGATFIVTLPLKHAGTGTALSRE